MRVYKFQLLLLALFVMVGCQKDEMSTSMKKGSYSLVASIENNDSTSRTAVDENGGVTWVATDAIGVFGTQTNNAKFESTGSGANVTFVGELESSHEEPTLAYYPYDKNASLDGNALSFTLPSEYSYTGQSYAPMLGIKQANGDFAFKHLVGLLKVTVKNMPENAKRLFVVSEGTEEKAAPAITGDVLVNDVTANNATLSITENKGREVSIDLKNTSAQETYTFYIPVPVGEYPNLSVKLEMNDGVIYMNKSVSDVSMTRAMMLDMPILDTVKEETSITAIVRGTVDIENPEGLIVRTLVEEKVLKSKEFSIEALSNGLPQFIYLTDKEDNVLMMGRDYLEEGLIELNAKNSALSLISILFSFSYESKELYREQIGLIESSSLFGNVVSEIQKCQTLGLSILDSNNEALMASIVSLLNDILNQPQSRAVNEITGINKQCLDVRTIPYSNVITMRNTRLNPAYECIISQNDIKVSNDIIAPAESIGILSLIEKTLLWDGHHYGPEFRTSFNIPGEYSVYCKKNTLHAILSSTYIMASDAISIMGVPAKQHEIKKISDFIDEFSDLNPIKNFIEGLSGRILLPAYAQSITLDDALKELSLLILKLASEFGLWAADYSTYYEKMMALDPTKLDIFDTPEFELLKKRSNLILYFKKLSFIHNIYDAAKGSINLGIRLVSMITAPSEIDFNLEYMNNPVNEIITSTDTKLKILGGNEQVGSVDELLEKPLMVSVETYSDDGNQYWNASWRNRLKIKFDVITDDSGSVMSELVSLDYISRTASTEWKLGNSREQKVRAVVVDAYTNLERSNPVYFTASTIEEIKYSITTGEAKGITNAEATLFGNIQGYEADGFIHQYGICYSTDTNPSVINGTVIYGNNITEDGTFSTKTSYIMEGTTYYYRAFVENEGNYVYGNVKSFTTIGNRTEREILIALYNSAGGNNWTMKYNWCSDLPLNKWHGVETDDEGHVISLSFSSLSGKADFRGLNYLEKLTAYGNGIVEGLNSINVVGLKKLKELRTMNHIFTELDLSGCISLELLKSGEKTLEKIYISDCVRLKVLAVNGKNFETLDLSNNTKLESLSCSANPNPQGKIKSLDLSKLTCLKELYCSGNDLTELDISANPMLEKIQCYCNELTCLDVSNNLLLKELQCFGNKLRNLDVSEHKSLELLRCEGNEIVDLNVDGCSSLKTLKCGENPLKKEIPAWFSQLDVFEYEVRYTDYYYDTKGELHYWDRGIGWWYPGEPERGYHIKE